ncbi:hypothetical protein EIP91_004610 [Steccherinum ochraceum]|uniref:Rad4-domain-containing protein n=1 Tax=Steccherinum ochraceum TaxID=92696 RepID=A0A4R0RMX8_9APHY|nr:hypothetical protein EIP91_004610 [Steccherinum ochraceum]
MSAKDLAAENDSEDDFDWEEVDVTNPPAPAITLEEHYGEQAQAGPSEPTRTNIEITIQARPKPNEEAKRRAVQLQAERAMRLDCHKIHTICLIGNARIRNSWLNDELLHARLMSLTPIALQNAFVITRAKVPEAPMRGRMFEAAVTRLAEWWQDMFFVESTGHLRSKPFEEVQQAMADAQARVLEKEAERRAKAKGKGKAKARARESDDDDDDGDEEEYEIIHSEKSLMKHTLMKRGSRDISAQLFTALCRALGIPARLVVSLQSVPWQAGVGKPKKVYKKKAKANEKGKGKEKATEGEEAEEEDDMDMEEVSIPGTPSSAGGKGKGKAAFPGSGQKLNGSGVSTPSVTESPKKKAPPVIRLRKSKGGRKLGSAPTPPVHRKQHPPDPRESAPVFWTEVFSRPDGRWLPVDPVRAIVNKRKAFDPDPSSNPSVPKDPNEKVENRMVYVLAFEEDGYARDVTPRYAREYGAKVSKVQQGGKGRKLWWEMILGTVTRPYRLNRDDTEDEELHNNQLTEQMPTSMTGFKDHPLYVLARHLKRDEVIYPLTELGKFRGEPVYARSSVIALKTAENWMRQGRKVVEGCQPMKWVKQRAVTVNRKRAIEVAMGDRAGGSGEGSGVGSDKDVMQGLYALNQTELYKADPIVDGVVPKNDFGNIDLYVPSMLPEGGAFIPHKGAAKIARQLGFDYAEAVTSFEFKKRRAFPVITGIVVAAENEQVTLEAFWEAEHEAEQKRQAKRQERVIKRWTRLVHGLRIRQRLQEQYADRSERPSGDATPTSQADGPGEVEVSVPVQGAGGFLVGADDVVQPYTLPRDVHDKPKTPPPVASRFIPMLGELDDAPAPGPSTTALRPVALGEDDFDEDDMDMVEEVIPTPAAVPKTMRELAEDAERERKKSGYSSPVEELLPPSVPLVAPTPKINGRTNDRKSQSGTGTPTTRGRAKATSTRKRTRREATSDPEVDDEVVEVEVRPAPAKRARPTPTPKATPTVKSDRVLRTRKSKTEEQMREEKEMEAAYRKAVAG